jgi:hypothetical protein
LVALFGLGRELMFAGTDVARKLGAGWRASETHARTSGSPASSQPGSGVDVTWFRDFVEEALTGDGCGEAIDIGLLPKTAERREVIPL